MEHTREDCSQNLAALILLTLATTDSEKTDAGNDGKKRTAQRSMVW